jgi:predicted nucleic acid-binding protein
MYLLDTNVISELRKLGDGRADARVAAWASDRDAASFYISALTLMELEIGILRIERRDAPQGKRLRTWMDRFEDMYGDVAGALETVRAGIDSPDHDAFVIRLRKATRS